MSVNQVCFCNAADSACGSAQGRPSVRGRHQCAGEGAAGRQHAIQGASSSCLNRVCWPRPGASSTPIRQGPAVPPSLFLHRAGASLQAAASRLLLGFAAEGPDSQEWIAAAPGAVPALVDLLRCAVPPPSTTTLLIAGLPPCAWRRRRPDRTFCDCSDRTWCSQSSLGLPVQPARPRRVQPAGLQSADTWHQHLAEDTAVYPYPALVLTVAFTRSVYMHFSIFYIGNRQGGSLPRLLDACGCV